jgi:hypothetical protein
MKYRIIRQYFEFPTPHHVVLVQSIDGLSGVGPHIIFKGDSIWQKLEEMVSMFKDLHS